MSRETLTLHDLVASYITEQCQVILVAEGQLRTGNDVVHATRVAIRRLRSTLRVFGEFVDVPQSGLLEEELVWFAGLLGQVRDLDVLEKRLLSALARLAPELVLGPVESQLQSEIAAQRTVARETVRETLDSDRYRQLLSMVDRWHRDPPMTAAAQTPAAKVSGFVKRADKKLRRRLAQAVAAEGAVAHGTAPSGAAGPTDVAAADELLHRARKAGKRHRYAAELAQPVLGARADRIIAARKDFQEVLGDHQDSVVTAAFLRSAAVQVGDVPGHNGFTYGLLYARELDSRQLLATRLEPFVS